MVRKSSIRARPSPKHTRGPDTQKQTTEWFTRDSSFMNICVKAHNTHYFYCTFYDISIERVTFVFTLATIIQVDQRAAYDSIEILEI